MNFQQSFDFSVIGIFPWVLFTGRCLLLLFFRSVAHGCSEWPPRDNAKTHRRRRSKQSVYCTIEIRSSMIQSKLAELLTRQPADFLAFMP